MKSISVIVPIKNEQDTLVQFFNRLIPVLENIFSKYEVICVNDGSTDRSLEIINNFCMINKNIKLLNLSKNFGAYNAVRAGSTIVENELSLWLAADLQDPPELLLEMQSYIEKGYDVVWGVRKSRKDPIIRKLLTNVFYKILNLVSEIPYPPKGVDLCLMNSKVRILFNNLNEKSGFIQALVINLGFNQKFIEYERADRFAGVSKWNSYIKLFHMAIEMISTTSNFPINSMLYLGIIGLPIVLLKFIYDFFNFQTELQLIVNLLLILLFTILLVGGWLGLYIFKSLSEVRNRPIFYIENTLNLSKNQLKIFNSQYE